MFLGSLLGSTSPVTTHSPLLGAELLLEPHTTLDLDVDPALRARRPGRHRRGLGVAGQEVKQNELTYVPPGSGHARADGRTTQPVRLLLLGGEPFGESIVMWWNFVGRSHDEIVAFREEWQAQITADGAVVADSQDVADGRFGVVRRPPAADPRPGDAARPPQGTPLAAAG